MKAFVHQRPDREAWGGTERIARFDVSALSSCDEPVRRYFTHAIAHGAPLEPRMRLRMTGRIKVGLWLPFTAQQDCDGSSFIWRAQVPRHGRILTVTDSYDDGRAAIDGRLLGALRLFHSDNQDIVRSAAGRAAAEGILTPIGLLPSPTRIWRAESDNEITLDLALAPERPALHVTIDHDGAVQSIHLQRWGDTGKKTFGYIPFGGDILAEERFGDFVLPARLRVGWWHGTERFSPFFEAEISSAVPNDAEADFLAAHDFGHGRAELWPPGWISGSGSAQEGASRDELDVVEVGHAVRAQPLGRAERYLGGEAPDGGGHGRDHESGEAGGDPPAGQHDDWPDFVEIRPPDIAMAGSGRHPVWRRRRWASFITSAGTAPS
jgi:hypothetical protein